MRVLHLSTYDAIGGAARSALRLHEGLRAAGIDSRMLVRKKKTTQSSIHVAPLLPRWRWRFWNFIEDGCIAKNRTPISNTFFTTGYPGYEIADTAVVRESDILHLHWVGNFLSPPVLAQLAQLGKPIVWTLHDQRPFTGGCHFSAGCDGYTRDCSGCPQLAWNPSDLAARNLSDQVELVPASEFTVVAPSKWLADAARKSRLFSQSRVEVIPYGVDTADFNPVEKSEARRKLGLDPEKFYVLFGADGGSEKRKGATELLAAFRQFISRSRQSEKIMLICFGDTPPAFSELGAQLHPLGYLRSTEQLKLAYSAADVFALSSLEDNLPNTMLESMACGTPVVGFPIGGVPDVVKDGATGRLAGQVSPAAFGDALLELSQNPQHCAELGLRAAELIASHYSPAIQAQKYQQLYGSLATAKSPQKSATPVPRHLKSILPSLFIQAVRTRLGFNPGKKPIHHS